MRLKLFVSLIIFATCAFAQVNTVYSRFGTGTLIYGTTARSLSFGELGTANYDDDRINLFNPASFGSFNLTRVDFGQVLEASFVSDSKKKNYYAGSYFPGFSMGIPVSHEHGVGIVFGVSKYSDVSYEGSRDGSVTGGGSLVPVNYKEEYFYDGGITKIFLGTSYRLPFGLNLGGTADFYMGHYEYNSTVKFFSDGVLNGIFAKQQNFKGFGATFGLITEDLNRFMKIDALDEIRLSAGYSLKATLKGDFSSYTVNNFAFQDTTLKGDMESSIPSRFFAGFSIKFNPRTKIFADYLTQSWTDYYMTNQGTQSLTNTFKVSAGFEYNPNSKSNTFEQALSYRLGLSYEKLPYLLSGESSYRMSAGVGISFPLSPANYIDLGLQYSFNSSNAANVIKDNTINFVIGLSIGELWFLRTDY